MTGTKAVAQRIVNAERNFAETVISIAGITESQAMQVLAVYVKLKLIKLDSVGGRYIAKTGQIYDKEVILRALAI